MRAALLLSLALHGLLLAAFAWQFRPLPALTPPLQVLLLPAVEPASAIVTGGQHHVATLAGRPPPQPAPRVAPAAAAHTPPAPSSARATPAASSPPPTPAVLPVKTMPAGKAAPIAESPPAGNPAGNSGSRATANLVAAGTAAATPAAAADGQAASGAEKAGASRAVQVRFSPKPPYPALSRELGEEGVVLLRISVSAGGQFEQVQLLRSSGFVRLDRAARDGVRNWRFDAAWQAGQAVAASIDIPVRFRLDES